MNKTHLLVAAFSVLLVIVIAIIFSSCSSDTPPSAESSVVTTQEDVPVSITLSGSDPEGGVLEYKIVTKPSHGSLSGTEPNLIYTPNPNFYGSDSISFKVSNGTSESTAAVISITVKSVNDSVKANNDTARVKEDAPLVTIDVLANDTDADNDKLVLLSASQGKNGSVTINTDNTVAYAPNPDFSGIDSFQYTAGDGKGALETASVTVTVVPVNDAPKITSKPVDMARVWGTYTYEVKTKDPDVNDTLVYSLVESPAGMTIDPNSGIIEWMPNNLQDGDCNVTVKVEDSNSVTLSDTQSFTITVTSLSSPLMAHLTVEKGYKKTNESLSQDEIDALRDSDDNRLLIDFNSYIYCNFSEASIPDGARIVSVILYVEHFEEGQFPRGGLQWYVGTGWPDNPVVWTSLMAPVHLGKNSEGLDSWDVTAFADSCEKINSMQIQIKNTNLIDGVETLVDCIYAVIEWY